MLFKSRPCYSSDNFNLLESTVQNKSIASLDVCIQGIRLSVSYADEQRKKSKEDKMKKVPLDDMNHRAKHAQQIREEILFGTERLEQIRVKQSAYATERKRLQIEFLEAFLAQLKDELSYRKGIAVTLESIQSRPEFDYAHLVQAIRSNSLVGIGTCSEIDECWDDDDLIEELQTNNIYTAEGAIQWAIEEEGIRINYATNYSSGEPDCRLIKRANAWAKAVESYHKSN